MSTEIKNLDDIRKLEAYLRVKAKGAFSFTPEMLKEVMSALQKHAESFKVDISLITSDGIAREVLFLTSTGALIGGVVGYIIAWIPGAIIGVMTGAALGAILAGIKLSLSQQDDGLLVLQIT